MQTLNSKMLTLLGSALVVAGPFVANTAVKAQSVETFSGLQISPEAIAQSQTNIPPFRQRFDPNAFLYPIDDEVSVTLINTSPSQVTYQVVGGTEFRVLEGGERTELLGLELPAQIRFAQDDGGMTSARVSAIMPEEEMVNIELSQAEVVEEDRGSVLVFPNGAIYIY